MSKLYNWMSLPKLLIPSRSSDNCEECGQYPKNIVNGIKHPYCSKTCAKRAAFSRPTMSAPFQRTASRSKDLCEECGQYPKNIVNGIKHPYCSNDCARSASGGFSKPTMSAPFQRTASHSKDLCEECGQYPKNIENGIKHPYCSKDCARSASGGFSKPTMSAPFQRTASRSKDLCEECGQYPKNIENGIKHPYCSKACARSASGALSRPTMSAPFQRTASRSKDLCEECGLYPKAIQQGYKHPYCSRTCAMDSKLRPPTTIQNIARPDLCPGCGRYPRAIEGGLRHTYCSKTCARKNSTNNPRICALLGCTAPASPAVGDFCSVAHANEWARPHHPSLQYDPKDIVIDPRSTKSSIPAVPRSAPRHRILFYHRHDPHYGFTNFSYHPIVYKGKTYPTSEHLFQSFKFLKHRPKVAEHIRTYSDKPSVAFSEARRYQNEVRSDWQQVKIEKMDIALRHKFTQHPDLKSELLATGDAELVEDSDKDAFWGVGPNGTGRNELGKALERLRAELRRSK